MPRKVEENELEEISWSNTKASTDRSAFPAVKNTKSAWEHEETAAEKLEKRIHRRREERMKRRSFSSDEGISPQVKEDPPSIRSLSESSDMSFSSLHSDSTKSDTRSSPDMSSSKEGMLYLKRKNNVALPVLSEAVKLENREKIVHYKNQLSKYAQPLPKLEPFSKGTMEADEEQTPRIKK